MNIHKLIQIFIALWLSQQVAGQGRVYLDAREVLDTAQSTFAVTRVTMPWGELGKHVIAISAGGEWAFHKREVWGVRLADGTRLRFFRGHTYEVLEMAPVVIYQTYGPHPVYYFSKDLSSDLRILRYSELKKTLPGEVFLAAFRQSPIIRRLMLLE